MLIEQLVLYFSDRVLYKENSKPEIYVIYGGKKEWIPDPKTFTDAGCKWSNIR